MPSAVRCLFAIFKPPIIEGWQGALENVHNCSVDTGILNCARFKIEVIPVVRFINRYVNYLFCIGNDRKIRIVGDDYDLPTLFCLFQKLHQYLIDALVVEIVFRLIDHKGNISSVKH